MSELSPLALERWSRYKGAGSNTVLRVARLAVQKREGTMSDYYDECLNDDCDNSDTDVLGQKDPVYKCDNCGGYSCPQCRNDDGSCPHCDKKELDVIGYIL